MDEVQKIIERYNKRKNSLPSGRYDFLNPWVYMNELEKECAIIRIFNKVGMNDLKSKNLLEIGCGNGANLLWFIRIGFSPHLLVGNELLPERAQIANNNTPKGLNIITGNALDIHYPENSFDIIYQSMVFSSILDDEFTQRLAQKIWSLIKVGGGILWYDFIYDNPLNKDVHGISFNKLKKLFPEAKIVKQKISLAPPLARRLTKISDNLYTLFNSLIFLRTHILCWIAKK